MPHNRHAVLSAYSSHRWLHFNPSARLELEFEDRETEAAAEGTAAHALAEHKLRKALKMRSTRPVSKYDSDEMEMYTDGYLEFVWKPSRKPGRIARTLRCSLSSVWTSPAMYRTASASATALSWRTSSSTLSI